MQNVESGVSLEDISSYGNFPNNRHVFSVLRAVRVSVLLYSQKERGSDGEKERDLHGV